MMLLAMLAEEAAAPAKAQGEAGHLFNVILQNTFYLALIVLFLTAVVAAFVAARKQDRCLRKFRGHPVTLQEQAGRRIWGLLKVFSKGIELVYEAPFDRPAKHSFLIYEGELGKVLALYRFVDRLDDRARRRRLRQARKMADPPLATRLWRWVRNVVNTFRDAVVNAMGMSLQQAARAAPNPVLQAQGGQINALGSLLVGETANAYEPMIEQYIGRPVIMEVTNPADPDKRVVEYHGYLGEYSPQFILLVDMRRRFEERALLGSGEVRFLEDAAVVRAGPEAVTVENRSAVPVRLDAIGAGDRRAEMGTVVEAGGRAEIPVPKDARGEGAAAAFSWEREFDVIVPRSAGLIRHASEPPDASRATP